MAKVITDQSVIVSKSHQFSADLMSLFAGILLPFAFSPFHLAFIAILAPALFLYFLLQTNHPYRQTLIFGIGFFTVGASWVFISIHKFGNSNIFLASFLTLLLILLLTSFIMLQIWCWQKCFAKNNTLKRSLGFPLFWILQEWLRCHLFTGFPFLLLAYSQTDSPLQGFAPLIGVYGVSFIILLLSSLIVNCFYCRLKGALVNLLFFILILYSGIYFSQISWTKQQTTPISVALVQGNIPQQVKWKVSELTNILQTYYDLTIQNWHHDLIIWPEGAIPWAEQSINGFLESLNYEAKKNHATLLTGIPREIPHSNDYYNAMLALGNGHGEYFKRHLVPFGEFVPFENYLRPLAPFFNLPMSNFLSGPNQQALLQAGKLKIAPFICYEIAFPNEVINYVNNANILVTISDDSWFGQSMATYQQFQAARFRALETRRYLLSSGNSGISSIVDRFGQIKQYAQPFHRTIVKGFAYSVTGDTPVMYFGSNLVIIFLLLFTGIILFIQAKLFS